MFQGQGAIFRQSKVQRYANTNPTLVLYWHLQNFVHWIPRGRVLGAETCRKLILRVIFSCFMCSCLCFSSFYSHLARQSPVGQGLLIQEVSRIQATTH
jgi:hypothetical protein